MNMRSPSVMTVWTVFVTVVIGLADRETLRADENSENDQPAAAESVTPVATVQTAVATESEISESISAFGTVMAGAGARQMVVAPLEVRISALLVSEGQTVKAGEAIAEVEPSPDTLLAFQEARNAADLADRARQSVRDRRELKLVTDQDLQSAEIASREAQARVEDLLKRGAGGKQTLPAPGNGVVVRIDSAAGQILPAGGSILEVDDPNQSEVRLGVEPLDAGRITAGQTITLWVAGDRAAEPATATIRQLSRQLNPETRLVDAMVTLPPEREWMIGAAVTANITLSTKKALVVPRQAALAEDGQYTLYTVADDHAVRHRVSLGLQNNEAVEIANAQPPVQVGESVVIQGNYELEDGMPVRTNPEP